MKIIDEKGNVITGRPDFSKGRYIQKEGDPDTLIYTLYTAEEMAEMAEQLASDPVTALQMAVVDLYEQMGLLVAANATE
jgi:hypothetical protein